MADEHNAFDLAKLAIPEQDFDWEPMAFDGQGRPVDLSGRPAPKDVRVRLNSGVLVRCDIRYSGVNPVDGDRLFTVIAEIDWENYFPKDLIVGEAPDDVEYRLRVPGLSDDVAAQYARQLKLIPGKIVRVK